MQLDWTTRLYLARDIAEGMRYLHKNGVIHRDLTSKVSKNTIKLKLDYFHTPIVWLLGNSTPANCNILMILFFHDFIYFYFPAELFDKGKKRLALWSRGGFGLSDGNQVSRFRAVFCWEGKNFRRPSLQSADKRSTSTLIISSIFPPGNKITLNLC